MLININREETKRFYHEYEEVDDTKMKIHINGEEIEVPIHDHAVVTEFKEHVRKISEKCTKMEQEIDDCCDIAYVLSVLKPEQFDELDDFCSEELDFHDDIWDADQKMDDESYEIMKRYVYGHLTIGQVIDLYLDIHTVDGVNTVNTIENTLDTI